LHSTPLPACRQTRPVAHEPPLSNSATTFRMPHGSPVVNGTAGVPFTTGRGAVFGSVDAGSPSPGKVIFIEGSGGGAGGHGG
jgi:hypothetical protein